VRQPVGDAKRLDQIVEPFPVDPDPREVDGQGMFSAAVNVGTRLNAWNTKPIRSRRSSVSRSSSSSPISWPPTKARPDVGVSSPAMQCSASASTFPNPTDHHGREPTPLDSTLTPSRARTTPSPPAVGLRQVNGAGSRRRGPWIGLVHLALSVDLR
jgi:hypothetical protein